MSKPVILTVDDDRAVSAAIARDLRRRYGAEAAVAVRLDSGKRVASALGEGTMSTSLVHRYLATI